MLRRIDCVMLQVDDLDEAVAFYERVFGLRTLWRDATSVGLAMFDTDAEIVLHTSAPPFSVHFMVDDVDVAFAEYVAHGCTVRVAPFEIVIGKCAVVEDPYGNAIAFLDNTKGQRDEVDHGAR